MKKFFDVVAKIKKTRENSCELHDSSPLNNVNDGFTRTDVFKCCPFDSDSFSSVATGYQELPEGIKNGQNKMLRTEPCTSRVSVKLNSSPIGPCVDPMTISEVPDHCILERQSETKKNMYVINISNSKCFHIGPQKTVNVVGESQASRNNINNGRIQPSSAFPSDRSNMDFTKLLDCDQKLTEDLIILISLYIDSRWKEFGKKLGLEELALEELEFRNSSNRSVVIYDSLQKYKTLFPNTSVGFVISVLKEIQNISLIEKLAQEVKH